MRYSGERKLVFPAITVIGVVLILSFILSTSIYQNLDRRHRLMIRSLEEKGTALFNLVQTILQSSTMNQPYEEYLHIYLYPLVSASGVIGLGIYSNELKPLVALGEVPPILPKYLRDANGQYSKVTRLPDNRKIFEIIKPFQGMMSDQQTQSEGYLQIALSMTEFEQAERDDLNYTLFLALILMAVGTAALYFIVVAQNYYLVNRTLKNVRTYATNLVESLADGLISFNERGTIVTMNKAAEELLGVQGKRVKGFSLDQLLTKAQVKELCELLEMHGKKLTREITIFDSDGKSIPVSVSRSEIIDGDSHESIGSLVVIHNLTELQHLRDQVRRTERLVSLGRLAAAIAHEIRNPLNAIRGFAQYLQEKFEPTAPERRYTGIMIKEIDRLDTVIRGLLEFARPMEPRFSLNNIADILKESLELISLEARTQSVQIEFSTDPALPLVAVDEEQMKQVFLNLLLNSLAAMSTGGTLSVRARKDIADDASERIAIDIEDTGEGIKQEDIDRIFDPFFTTKPQGTGLGLAIAHRIIENHRASIIVSSDIGEGTRFTIFLPLTKEIGGMHD